MTLRPRTKTHSIYEILRGEISEGTWNVGDKLPGDVELAVRFGCSTGTVNRAMTSLAHEGWIERRMRAGSRVLQRIPAEVSPSLQLDAFACIYTSERHEGVWRMVQGFQLAADEVGRRSVMFGTGSDFRKEAEIVGRLAEFDVKGALLIPVISGPADQVYFSQMVLACKFPLVVADSVLMGLGASHVTFDGFHAGRSATLHLLEQGARRIGFLSNNSWTPSMRDRYQGYLRALDDAGIEERPELVLREQQMHPNFENPLAESKQLVRTFLESCPGLDGLVCGNDFQAVACVEVARELGIAVPGELKVTGVNDFQIASQSRPTITSYHVPYEEIGRESFFLLNRMLNGGEKPGAEIRVKGNLITRESSGGSAADRQTSSFQSPQP